MCAHAQGISTACMHTRDLLTQEDSWVDTHKKYLLCMHTRDLLITESLHTRDLSCVHSTKDLCCARRRCLWCAQEMSCVRTRVLLGAHKKPSTGRYSLRAHITELWCVYMQEISAVRIIKLLCAHAIRELLCSRQHHSIISSIPQHIISHLFTSCHHSIALRGVE